MKPIRTVRATLKDKVKPVTGEVHFRVYKQGKIIDSFDDHNLVVDAGRIRLANLAAGKTTAAITHIGVGSGSTVENVADTELENQQLFPLTSIEVNGRDVQCNFFIANNQAIGLKIREFGLFCADGTMFSHRVRKGVIEKYEDIQIAGYWILHF